MGGLSLNLQTSLCLVAYCAYVSMACQMPMRTSSAFCGTRNPCDKPLYTLTRLGLVAHYISSWARIQLTSGSTAWKILLPKRQVKRTLYEPVPLHEIQQLLNVNKWL